jgi:hypothetical protein
MAGDIQRDDREGERDISTYSPLIFLLCKDYLAQLAVVVVVVNVVGRTSRR